MLTKREKILLQILGILFLLALTVVFLLTPAMTSFIKTKSEQEMLKDELKKVEEVKEYPGLNERLQDEKEKADQNYEYFYSVLNSYTIDGIVNKLLQKENLKVDNLTITPYESGAYDFALLTNDIEEGEETQTEGEEEENEQFLVKSTITLKVQGNKESILRFIDELNDTSNCLRVSSMKINDIAGVLGGTEEKEATLKIFVYGIDLKPIEEVLGTMEQEADQTKD